MEFDVKMMLLLLPIVLIHLSLAIWSLTDWLKRKQFNVFPRMIWLFVFLFIQLIGPLFYLLFGRKDEDHSM